MTLNTLLLVGLGGALGAVGRYAIGVWVRTSSGFPWATLCVNLLGALLLGVLMGWLSRQTLQTGQHDTLRLFLAVGVLGGFTTFSAFSMDLFTLLEKRDMVALSGYVGSSLVGGLAGFTLGYMVVRAG